MKKTILTTIVALFVFTMGANAQGIGIGIKGGLNLAKLNGMDDVQNTENRLGIHGGAYVNLNLGGVSIQPEILYSAQGSNFEGPNDAIMKVNYMYIPVIVKIPVLKVLNLQVGPQFGFVSSADAENFDGDLEGDIKDQLKNQTFDVALGAGVNLPLGFTADVRYIYGFTDINDGLPFDDDVKNRVVQISVGWTIIGGN